MDYQLFPYLVALLFVPVAGSFFYLCRYTSKPGVPMLSLYLLTVLGWMICNVLELVTLSEEGTLLWAQITYIFIVSAPVFWVFFVYDYFGYRNWIKLPGMLWYWVIPFLTLLAVFTNSWHHLFWRQISFLPVGNFLAMRVVHGPLYVVIWIFSQVMILTGVIFMLRENFLHIRFYRDQIKWILAAAVITTLSNSVYVIGALPEVRKDYTPVALALSGLCFVAAVSRHQFIKIAPIGTETLFETIDDSILVVNTDSIIVNASKSIHRLFNIQQDDLVGKSLSEVFSQYPAFCEAVLKLADEPFELCLEEHPPFFVSIKLASVQDYSKFLRGKLVLVRDITQQKLVQLAEQQERAFAEALSKIAAALNSTRNLEELFEMIIGYAAEVNDCASADIMMVEGDYARVVCSHNQELNGLRLSVEETENLRWMTENKQAVLMSDVRNSPGWKLVPGTEWIRSYVGAPVMASGKVIGFINLNSAKTGQYDEKVVARLSAFADQASIAIQNARTYKELEELANLDGLTYLYNRRCFFDLANREFARVKRHQRALAAMMIDVDHFKIINDSFGHRVGDQVLYRIAQICKEGLRTIDLIGRYGGEEFAVILPDTNQAEAQYVAERICRQIASAKIDTPAGEQHVTVSIGVAIFDSSCLRLEDLLAHSDQAMYRAKDNGRNRVEIYTPLSD